MASASRSAHPRSRPRRSGSPTPSVRLSPRATNRFHGSVMNLRFHVLVEAIDVVVVVGAFQLDQALVLRVAVPCPGQLLARLDQVVHVGARSSEWLQGVPRLPTPRHVLVVLGGILPGGLDAEPERRRPARER